MRYLVMDAVGKKVEVEATTPRKAREKAKGEMRGVYVGELTVWERQDPLQHNREGTQEFFGARPPIIL